MKNSRKVKVSIPRSLFDRISVKLDPTRFASVSDYVTYVLRRVEIEGEKITVGQMSEEDQERIKKKLTALGYLD